MKFECAQNLMKRLPTISHILIWINVCVDQCDWKEANISEKKKLEEKQFLRFNAMQELHVFVSLYVHIESHGSSCKMIGNSFSHSINDFMLLVVVSL